MIIALDDFILNDYEGIIDIFILESFESQKMSLTYYIDKMNNLSLIETKLILQSFDILLVSIALICKYHS